VAVEVAHKHPLSLRSARAAYRCSIAALLVFFSCNTLPDAFAEGETRTISFHHVHTKENLTVTYKRNGRYDEEALKQINNVLRDWREQEPTKMDPHVIDLLWEVHREVGAKEPISIICGYRSPGTNAMLRKRSNGVAKFSQHVNGKAIDFFIPGIALEDLQAAGLRAQRGGVGIYPSSGFVHMDTGSVRHWPRMPEAQVARILSKGQLASRFASDDGSVRQIAVAQAAPSRSKSFLAKLFGGGKDEEDHDEAAVAPVETAPARTAATAAAPRAEKPVVAAAAKPAEKTAAAPVPPAKPARAETVASATSKPAAKPATFQVASAASKTVAVVVTPDAGEVASATPVAAKTAPAAGSFQVASATSTPVRPAQAASLVAQASASPNEIINERGHWQAAPSAESAEARAAAPAPRRAATGVATASADPANTASVAPWPMTPRREGAEPMPNALAYAAQPTPIAAARPQPMGTGTPRAAPAGETTVATKRSDDRPGATPPKASSLVQVGDKFNDPWMRAMIVSPSAQSYMRTTLFGLQDFRSLVPHMHKPAAIVAMSFSADPSAGLTTDKFTGAAVVFISTVSFSAPRTAALR
jgi:uncharacterized protein YcbK (DUF882 family)